MSKALLTTIKNFPKETDMKLITIFGLAVLCCFASAGSVFAECDTPPTALAPEGGSVWDKALANPNYSDGGGSGTDSSGDNGDTSDSAESSDSSPTTGGRLVDPSRDVYYSDGTVGVDVLNP
jgi:hypothetical protein